MEKVCFVCLEPSKLKCSRCLTIQYCSKECQKKDWKVHKDNCNDNNHHLNAVVVIEKANSYFEQGNYAKSEKAFLKVLPQFQEMYGRDSEQAIGIQGQLASCLYKQAKYSEAEVLLKDCMKNDKHPCLVEYKSDLATIYSRQGKYFDADIIYQECLKRSKEDFGDDHENTVCVMESIATNYLNMGKYVESEILFVECIKKMKALYVGNDDHSNLLSTMNNLGRLYSVQNKYKECEAIYQECYDKMKRSLGANHPSTLPTMHNLGCAYCSQGKYKEAKVILEECLKKNKAMNGNQHPNTLGNIRALARVEEGLNYQNISASASAGQFISTTSVSSYMPIIANISSSTDDIENDFYTKQLNVCLKTFEKNKSTLGEEHPDTLQAMYNLWSCL